MISRYELMTLKPEQYLAQGFCDASGMARAELTGLWAFAAAEQLRLQGVTAAAFDPLVAEATRSDTSSLKTPEPGARLIQVCRKYLKGEAERAAFHQYLGAVLRLLALSEANQTVHSEASPPLR